MTTQSTLPLVGKASSRRGGKNVSSRLDSPAPQGDRLGRSLGIGLPADRLEQAADDADPLLGKQQDTPATGRHELRQRDGRERFDCGEGPAGAIGSRHDDGPATAQLGQRAVGMNGKGLARPVGPEGGRGFGTHARIV